MTESPERAEYQPSELINRLTAAQTNFVEISLKDGVVVRGRLNHVGESVPNPGKGYIIIDSGVSQTIGEDEIEDFLISTK